LKSEYKTYKSSKRYGLCPPSKKEINMVFNRKYLDTVYEGTGVEYDYYDSMRLYVIKCNKKRNSNCKSDEEIETLLQNTYWKMNLYEEMSKFSF
jgi:hypothetical protein